MAVMGIMKRTLRMLVHLRISRKKSMPPSPQSAPQRWNLRLPLSTNWGLVGMAQTRGLIHRASFRIGLWRLRNPPCGLSSSIDRVEVSLPFVDRDVISRSHGENSEPYGRTGPVAARRRNLARRRPWRRARWLSGQRDVKPGEI